MGLDGAAMSGQSSRQHVLAVFASAALLRLCLFYSFPSVSNVLGDRVEVSTPVSSFKRLQEGLFLYTHDVSPYDGGVYHQAPIFLPIFALFPDPQYFALPTNLIYILADLLSASALYGIAQSGLSVSSTYFTSPRKELRWTPIAVAAAYLFNPFTITACLGKPTSVFTNCAILQAVAAATSGQLANSCLALSMASYFSLYPILLAPPLALVCHERISVRNQKTQNVLSFGILYSVGVLAGWAVLLILSFLLMGNSWEFLSSTYGVQLTLSDLTPNVGLWWYFFIEMFDSFRDFFLGVFWLHMISYMGGMTIRLRKQPLFVVASLLGIFAMYKPYPSITDTCLFLAMLPLYRHVFPLLRYGFIAAAALLYSIFLGPAFFHLWIYAGSGNANFFYAITLVWSLGMTILIADCIFAVLRDELEVDRPEIKGQQVTQI